MLIIFISCEHREELSAANQAEHPATDIDALSQQPNFQEHLGDQAQTDLMPSIHMKHEISHILGTDKL